MKQLIVLAAAAFLSASCGTMHKTQRTDVKRVDSTANVQRETVTDRVITERIDTTVLVGGDTIRATVPVPATNDTTEATPPLQVLETPTQLVEARYNAKTRAVDITAISKPRAVPVKVERTVVENERAKEISTTHVVNDEKHHKAEKHRESALKGIAVPFSIVVVGLIVLLFLLRRSCCSS